MVLEAAAVEVADSAADSEVASEEAAPPSKSTSTFTYPHQSPKSSDRKDPSRSVKLRNITKLSSLR